MHRAERVNCTKSLHSKELCRTFGTIHSDISLFCRPNKRIFRQNHQHARKHNGACCPMPTRSLEAHTRVENLFLYISYWSIEQVLTNGYRATTLRSSSRPYLRWRPPFPRDIKYAGTYPGTDIKYAGTYPGTLNFFIIK